MTGADWPLPVSGADVKDDDDDTCDNYLDMSVIQRAVIDVDRQADETTHDDDDDAGGPVTLSAADDLKRN